MQLLLDQCLNDYYFCHSYHANCSVGGSASDDLEIGAEMDGDSKKIQYEVPANSICQYTVTNKQVGRKACV